VKKGLEYEENRWVAEKFVGQDARDWDSAWWLGAWVGWGREMLSTFFYITNSIRTSQETIHLRSVARNSDH
jgi:hypothetical protein